jgi:hypothetical protein
VSANGRFAQNNKTLTETKFTFYGSGNFQSSFEAIKHKEISHLFKKYFDCGSSP